MEGGSTKKRENGVLDNGVTQLDQEGNSPQKSAFVSLGQVDTSTFTRLRGNYFPSVRLSFVKVGG